MVKYLNSAVGLERSPRHDLALLALAGTPPQHPLPYWLRLLLRFYCMLNKCIKVCEIYTNSIVLRYLTLVGHLNKVGSVILTT